MLVFIILDKNSFGYSFRTYTLFFSSQSVRYLWKIVVFIVEVLVVSGMHIYKDELKSRRVQRLKNILRYNSNEEKLVGSVSVNFRQNSDNKNKKKSTIIGSWTHRKYPYLREIINFHDMILSDHWIWIKRKSEVVYIPYNGVDQKFQADLDMRKNLEMDHQMFEIWPEACKRLTLRTISVPFQKYAFKPYFSST